VTTTPAQTGPATLFQGAAYEGKCTTALNAAINAVTLRCTRDLIKVRDRTSTTTSHDEQMAVTWIESEKYGHITDETIAARCDQALHALADSRAACPCPLHEWQRRLPAFRAALTGYLDRVWIITYDGEVTYQAGLDDDLMFRYAGDDPLNVTVTWTAPVLTYTYEASHTVTAHALDDTRSRQWDAWWACNDHPAEVELAAARILTTESWVLDAAPAVYAAIEAADGPKPMYADGKLSYAAVVDAISEARWAPATPAELKTVTDLAGSWPHTLTDLLHAARLLPADT
jgi:hypothetical protein